ncbi:hypothetical protein QEX65_gp13 [Arthrobacter phage Noely]|uniref:H-type lectin domain-containing protein n=1 Tax=Arthrobacter phage Noely TaxID=2419964 RepID=A0A3G2KAG4_9CAUD|nr:hypothetical protein QEX65_gp13 [Arthrobacter phage Noely]AYN55954.1 hypothetical protein PBI_NOELY_13 [Arthrobacter phage Noely]
MGTTLKRGYRYPGQGAEPDVAGDVQKLAEDVSVDVDGVATDVAGLKAKRIPAGTQAGMVTVTVNNATAAGSVAVAFPAAFAAAPNGVVLTMGQVSGSASTMRRLQTRVTAVTATGFTANLETSDGSNVGATFAVPCHWVAVLN